MAHIRGDRGDTLVEVLVALAVLSIGITALMGGLLTNITTTGVNRDQAHVSSTLLSASEYVKALTTVPCGTPAVTITTTQVPHDPGFSVSYGPAVAFDANTPCTEMLRVPVRVVGNGFDVSLDVVRRP